MSSSSVEEQIPPNQVQTTVTMSTSSFEIVDHDDDNQTVSHVPRTPDQHLQAPINPQNVQDIWSDDDEVNITTINKGMSTKNIKAVIHTNIATKVKSSIEVDSTDTQDADDEADNDDIEYFRLLTERSAAVDLKIATDGFHKHQGKLHDLIPELYMNKFDISDFPQLSHYYSQAIGPLPNQEFVCNVLDLVFQKFPHLQTIQEYLYSVIKCFLVGLKHPDWMQFCFIDDNVSDPTLTEDHQRESLNQLLVDDQDSLHDKTQDFDCTYVTTDSVFLEQRLLQKQAVYRTVSCPDLEKGVRYTPQVLKANSTKDLSSESEEILGTELEEGPRASTPVETQAHLDKLPKKVTLQELLHQPGGLSVPATDIIAALGLQVPVNNNLAHATHRLQNMAWNAQRGLRGADLALTEILNRMENKDNTRKKFLMFPKQAFDGKSKQAAKNHWLEFQKYITYQTQQELLDPDDNNQFPEVKQMFRLTLADNTLGWYDTENGNWTTLEHIKQAILKQFNIWGDTRRQQQDSCNKLQFIMANDDVDSFVTDMRTLASILGHNEEIMAEKFKDVFPDKNIEAALIAMNNFREMQTKAKQLVQIYYPNHTQDSSSLGASLIHIHEGTATGSKLKTEKPKVSNQHQLAPTQHNDGHKQSHQQTQNRGGYKGNNSGPRQGQANDGYYHENNFRNSSQESGSRGVTGRGHRPWPNNPNTGGQSSN